jgi:hypothetical protein
MIICWSGFEVVWKPVVVLVIGYVLIGVSMAFDKERPPLDWKSATWLPAYLIGMGIISWQGQFSGGAVLAPVSAGNIPFWADMGVVAAFSLVICYWAQAVKCPRQRWKISSAGRQEARQKPRHSAKPDQRIFGLVTSAPLVPL